MSPLQRSTLARAALYSMLGVLIVASGTARAELIDVRLLNPRPGNLDGGQPLPGGPPIREPRLAAELDAARLTGGELVGANTRGQIVLEVDSRVAARAAFLANRWNAVVTPHLVVPMDPLRSVYLYFGPNVGSSLPTAIAGFVLDPKDRRTFDSGITSIRATPPGGHITAAAITNLLAATAGPGFSHSIRYADPAHVIHQGGVSGASGASCSDVDAYEAVGSPTSKAAYTHSSKVAVLDTGVDTTQADLVPNLLSTGRNFTVTPESTNVMDGTGHGTHVAGVIAAKRGNGFGIDGLGWKTKILPVKVTQNGLSFPTTGRISDAIRYATGGSRKARIVNISWWLALPSLNIELAIEEGAGKARPVVFVVAAGNRGIDLDVQNEFPASYGATHENVLTILATWTPDDSGGDVFSGSSNFGASSVFMGAPGVDICSTSLAGSVSVLSGTSASAPFVSGAISLMLSEDPTLDIDEIRSGLDSAGIPVPGLVGRCSTGKRLMIP